MVKRDFCTGDRVESPEEAKKRLQIGTRVCLLEVENGFNVYNEAMAGHLRNKHGSSKVQIIEGQEA